MNKKFVDKRKMIIGVVTMSILAIIIVGVTVAMPQKKMANAYKQAEVYFNQCDYNLAMGMYEELGNYKDSQDKMLDCRYATAKGYMSQREYLDAITVFGELGEYRDSSDQLKLAKYEQACFLLNDEQCDEAKALFYEVKEYADSEEKIKQCEDKKLYMVHKAIIDDFWAEYGYPGCYGFYDIDKDGEDEYIVYDCYDGGENGMFMAHLGCYVYKTIDGELKYIGELYSTELYELSGRNGILSYLEHKGTRSVYEYYIEDNELKAKEIASNCCDWFVDIYVDETAADYNNGEKQIVLNYAGKGLQTLKDKFNQ